MLYSDEVLKDSGYMLSTVGKKVVTFYPKNIYSNATPEAPIIALIRYRTIVKSGNTFFAVKFCNVVKLQLIYQAEEASYDSVSRQ